MKTIEVLAVARLRQWAQERRANLQGKATVYRRTGWGQRNSCNFDAALVRCIDFERALERLSDREQIVLVRRYRDGETEPKIAAACGCSVRTLNRLIPSARLHLANVLDTLNLL
jgi:DNA-directed RNA polymerase specialized sigma24 family protein